MKTSNFIFVLLCFIGLNSFAQENSAAGVITNVKPHFAGEYAMNVGKTEVVLIVNQTDKTFEINKEYKDLLVEKKGKYILNPKYNGKQLHVTYYVNGKGWKCIQSIKSHHK
jgi:hypothetical protein